jgi:hypothetical protein
MTQRELVMAALAGREANRVPLAVTTQTSPRNYPGSCSQRAPKKPKGDGSAEMIGRPLRRLPTWRSSAPPSI